MYALGATRTYDTEPFTMPPEGYLAKRPTDLVLDIDSIDFVDSQTGVLDCECARRCSAVTWAALLHRPVWQGSRKVTMSALAYLTQRHDRLSRSFGCHLV